MNVLILTGKFGMGHLSAANNLADKINSNMENVNVYVIDLFSQTLSPAQCSLMYTFYSSFAKRGSKMYNLVYNKSENNNKNNRFIFEKLFINSLNNIIYEFEPDTIISTFPFCSKITSSYKMLNNSKIPLITCITDVSCHNDWINPLTDIYLVATQSVKLGLVNKNVEQEKIIVSGIPVKDIFKEVTNEDFIKRKHLLIMGGGLGLLPKSKTFYDEINSLESITTTVITGNNKVLYNKLHGKYKNIEVIGFTNKVNEYMQSSDLIISKPGGITTFEAIFSELPLVTFKPFLQQEIKNGKFIKENNLGVIISKNPSKSVDDIVKIINDDNILNSIKENMRIFKNQLDDNAITRILSEIQSVNV